MILDADGANAGSELRTETPHPGLFRHEVEAVDNVDDEPVSGTRACFLGNIQPDLVEVPFDQRREAIPHPRTSSGVLLDRAT